MKNIEKKTAPVAVAEKATVATAPDVAPAMTVPAPVVGPLPAPAEKYLFQTTIHNVKFDVWENADGSRDFRPVVVHETALEKKQRELTEKATAENADYRKAYIETAKLNGLSYIVEKPNCMHVTYKAVESTASPDGIRIIENRTLSDFHRFTDVWDVTAPVMIPVLQALSMLPSAESKTAIKSAVWPLAKACNRAVPGDRCLELLQSMRKYRQLSLKGYKLNSYENVANDVEKTLVQFLNTCPVATAEKPAEK